MDIDQHNLYLAAQAAETAFQRALVSRYGSKADEMRTSPQLCHDLVMLRRAKIRADEALANYVRTLRDYRKRSAA